jgi:hypothetical protein
MNQVDSAAISKPPNTNYTKEFDYFIPLGMMCTPADRLNTYGLRKAAYPLDWILVDFEALVPAVADGFSKFTDYSNVKRSSYHLYMDSDDPVVTNLAYGGAGIQYRHHNPLDPEKAAQLSRSLDRWKKLEKRCNSENVKVLFVSMSHELTVPENAAEQLMEALEKRFPRGSEKSNIELLFIETVFVPERIGVGFTAVSSNSNKIRHVKIDVPISQKETLFAFSAQDKDVWDLILSQYKFASSVSSTQDRQDIADKNRTLATLNDVRDVDLDSLLPADFVWDVYTSLHKDLADMTEEVAKKHYLDHGKREGRRYKIDKMRRKRKYSGNEPERLHTKTHVTAPSSSLNR